MKKSKISWNITHECNRQCKHCHLRSVQFPNDFSHIKWLPEQDALRVVDKLAYNGVERLGIAGGEPTLVPHLVALIEYASEICGLELELVTNGSLIGKYINEQQIMELSKHLSQIALSLDYSVDNPDRAWIYGRGHSQALMVKNAVNLFKKYGIYVQLKTMVFGELSPIDELYKIAKFAQDQGIDELQLRQYFTQSHDTYDQEDKSEESYFLESSENFKTTKEQFLQKTDTLINAFPEMNISVVTADDMQENYILLAPNAELFSYGIACEPRSRIRESDSCNALYLLP